MQSSPEIHTIFSFVHTGSKRFSKYAVMSISLKWAQKTLHLLVVHAQILTKLFFCLACRFRSEQVGRRVVCKSFISRLGMSKYNLCSGLNGNVEWMLKNVILGTSSCFSGNEGHNVREYLSTNSDHSISHHLQNNSFWFPALNTFFDY